MKMPHKKENDLTNGRTAKSILKYARIAPRKVRPVINTIRFQHPEHAFQILAVINKKAARLAEKVLKSAVANAKVLGMDETRLIISDVRADGGPSLKRFMARSMGRADQIVKRMTHLSVVIMEGHKTYRLENSPEARAAEMELKTAKDKKKTAAANA